MGHSLGMFLGPVLAGLLMDTFQLDLAFVAGTAVMIVGTLGAVVFTSGFQRGPEEK
jgi:MFS family permease